MTLRDDNDHAMFEMFCAIVSDSLGMAAEEIASNKGALNYASGAQAHAVFDKPCMSN